MRFISNRPRNLFGLAGASLLLSAGLLLYVQDARNWLPAGTMRLFGSLIGLLNMTFLPAFSLGALGVVERNSARAGAQASSAVPVDDGLPRTLHAKRTRALMSAFDFTADDLEANQRGQLTPRQEGRRKNIALTWIFGSMFGIGIVVFIVLKMAFSRPGQLQIAWLGLAVPVVFALVIASSIRRLWTTTIRIAAGLIRHCEIENRMGKGPRIVHITRLGDAEFYLPPEERERFKQDEPYRIYYLNKPSDHIILSVAALRPDGSRPALVRVKPWRKDEEY